MLPYTILSFFPAPVVTVQIIANGAPVLEQNGYSLTCTVSGTNRLSPSIAYQWTKNNGTQTQIQVGADNVLSFSPLRLSDAGQYTCQATIRSPYLNNDITMMSSNLQNIMLQGEPCSTAYNNKGLTGYENNKYGKLFIYIHSCVK